MRHYRICEGIVTFDEFLGIAREHLAMPKNILTVKVTVKDRQTGERKEVGVKVDTVDIADIYINGVITGSNEPMYIVGKQLPSGEVEFYLAAQLTPSS